MSVEMRMLTLSVALGIVQILAASHAASLQRGYRWTASPRDEKVEPLRGVAGRLNRALRNFSETFPLFAAVVLAAQLTGTHNALTVWGGTTLLLGPGGVRATLCRRDPADPFARVERWDHRHHATHCRPGFGVSNNAPHLPDGLREDLFSEGE